MAFPQMLGRALAEVKLDLDGALVGAVECEGAKFHSPQPLLVRRVGLIDESEVWLCGTCEANLTVLHGLLKAGDGKVAWPVRREFGNLLRELAMRGWSTDG